jgi:hypothetical protein
VTCFHSPARLALAIVGFSVLIVSTACGASTRSGGGDPFRGSPSGAQSGDGVREIRIEVHNTNFNGGTVYAIRAGSRRRLGRVEGGRDEEFKMPWLGSDRLSFEVDLLGREGCVTRPVVVLPGQALLLTIYSTSRAGSNGINSMCEVRGTR